MSNPVLQMTFTPNTIEHLGVKMYSTLPPVIAELVANSRDADASEVYITLNDKDDKEIIVSDNGHGMSFGDINDKFLRIGRNRRVAEANEETPGGRKIIGKKGLGKLSFFGIAHEIEVITVKDKKKNSFLMKWDNILSENDSDKQKNYNPEIIDFDVDVDEKSGTTVILRNIKRASDFDSGALSDSLSKFFIIDEGFNIFIKHNDDNFVLINNEQKYNQIIREIEWKIPEDLGLESDYEKRLEVRGHLIAAEKPIPPSTSMKGITLFSRKKLVNLPEYFSDSTSSHFFTYLTGWLEVDFIDDLGEDVIGTNRQSLNWDYPELIELRIYLQKMLRWLEVDWRAKRALIKQEKLDKELSKTGISISEWQKNVPDDLNRKLNPILETILEKSEFSDQDISGVVKNLKDILPPYPYYHYLSLHKTLSAEVFDYYSNKDYFTAVTQGVVRYIREVQKKTGLKITDLDLIKKVFCPDQQPKPAPRISPFLSVVNKFKRPDGTEFEELTKRNINSGHGLLTKAMWMAFRCPLNHESSKDLAESGLYTERDCLDALGLLSHLFRRLDNSDLS